MDTDTSNKRVNSYFRFMKNWDNDSKKGLIIKLTESIDNEPKRKYDFSSSFGAWIDDRSADEIIKDLYQDRVNINEIEDF